MPTYRYQTYEPQIGEGCFLAPSSDIIGRVHLGKNVSVWFRTVLRGDVGDIYVGDNVNIQDLSMLHITEGLPLNIGDNTTIGHSVTLHSAQIGNHCLIGMGAVVLDCAKIGDYTLVAAGSLVPPHKTFPPGVMIRGNPAKVVRELTEEEKATYGNHYKSYLVTKNEYLKNPLNVL